MKTLGCITTFINDTHTQCECCGADGVATLPLEYMGVILNKFFTPFIEKLIKKELHYWNRCSVLCLIIWLFSSTLITFMFPEAIDTE